MNYEVKPKAEGSWLALQGATVTLITSILLALGVDHTVAAAAGGFGGVALRPVAGYLLSWLPRRKPAVGGNMFETMVEDAFGTPVGTTNSTGGTVTPADSVAPSERGAARLDWRFTLAYVAIGVAWLVVEGLAIADPASGDTFTENVRTVIFVHPVVWYSSIGLFLGFGVWLTRHFWWRQH